MNPGIYGGGAPFTIMTPAVLIAAVIAAMLVLVLPRKYALAPMLVVVFLTPFGQQLFLGGLHFYVIRLIVLAGALRLLAAKLTSGKALFAGGFNTLDKVFCIWVFVRGMAFILLERTGGAVTYEMSLWLDAFGAYFMVRYFVQDKEDILRMIKVLASVAVVLGLCMTFEFLTRVNVFSYLAGYPIVPWMRNGNPRSQGVFGNSITAGSFGAVLLPLIYWLWKSGKARLWGIGGLLGAVAVSLTSNSSTAITGLMAAVLGLCLWPIRKRMKSVRWGIVTAVIALALVMHAPVWYVITRVNVVSGDSWDRAYLMDQTSQHISEWWLFGTTNNAKWGDFMWDQCDQFAAEAIEGGLAGLILFLLIFRRAFGAIGQWRQKLEGEREEWLFWCLGTALFTYIIIFLGIDYFDQTRTLWYVFLATISVATFGSETVSAPVPEPEPVRYAPRRTLVQTPATGRLTTAKTRLSS